MFYATAAPGDAATVPTGLVALSRTGVLRPMSDNTQSLGTASARFSQVYAGTATINTSDAREKTPVVQLDQAELDAARDLAAEIGLFQFLSACAQKGDSARRHIGMTVQRAIEIMERHGLDPLAYAFICHDTWEAVPATDAVEDEDGNVLIPAQPGRSAGDRYGFRFDELLLFVAAGFEKRLAILEAKAA
ncbi:tail fiber domain-containing protein [Methylorubrum aminovorans]